GLGDDSSLPHALGEEHLRDGVVHLVRPRMTEILALEPDARADLRGEVLRKIEGRGAADVMLEEVVELALERGVARGLFESTRELVERRHQRLGDVAAAVGTEAAGRVLAGGHGAGGLADSVTRKNATPPRPGRPRKSTRNRRGRSAGWPTPARDPTRAG